MASTAQKNIWKFVQGENSTETDEQGLNLDPVDGAEPTGYGPAPQIIPFDGKASPPETDTASSAQRPMPKMSTIDVVSEYAWTYSPPGIARDETPKMILREERILQNPTFNALAYNLFTATDMLDPDTAESVKKLASTATTWMGGKVSAATSGLSKDASKSLEDFSGSVKKFVTELTTQTGITGGDAVDFQNKNYRRHLEPYQRLYSTIPTGFKYKLPYFSDEFKTNQPKFTDSAGGQSQLPLQSAIASGTSQIASIVNSINAVKPGTYIESPKYPQFPASEKSYTLSFPLLNTVSYDDTYKNWQLVFLLLYQNLPNRVNRNVILPPKIYEARIPGVWYSRYAYISNISVKMLGARREMKFTGMEIGGPASNISTVVPDAYQIDMTIAELIPESQNYMLESILRDNLVSVDIRDSANVAKPAAAIEKSAKDLAAGAANSAINTISNAGSALKSKFTSKLPSPKSVIGKIF